LNIRPFDQDDRDSAKVRRKRTIITDLGNGVFIEFQPDEFQLAGWAKHRPISSAPIPNQDANTRAKGDPPTFDVGDDGNNIIVSRVQGKVALDLSQCWVVSARATTALLTHEQGHYYITYIPYVLALQAIKDLTAPLSTVPARATGPLRQQLMHDAIVPKAQTILNQAQARMSQLTSDYDATNPPGTNHGLNGPEQMAWNGRFATSLLSGSPL
jgi:hypothetical protein